jgi:hypothetical protein
VVLSCAVICQKIILCTVASFRFLSFPISSKVEALKVVDVMHGGRDFIYSLLLCWKLGGGNA